MSLAIKAKSNDANKHTCNVSSVISHNDFVISGSDDGKIKLSTYAKEWALLEDQIANQTPKISLLLQALYLVWKPNLEPVTEFEASGGILSLAAGENKLYACSTAEVIQCWDLSTAKQVGNLSTTLSQPQKLFFDKKSNLLWAGDSQGNVSKFENGKESGQYALIEEIWDIMVHPPFVYTARDRDVVICEIVVGTSGTRVVVKSTLEGRSPFCIAGSRLCFFDRDGRRVLVHENSLEKKFPRLSDIPASDLIINAIVAASDNVIYTGGYDSTLKKWDLNDLKCVSNINLNSCINSISARSENEVYVATSDGSLCFVGA